MHYKLLALDLDGTALSDPNTFAPGLAEAAAQAAAAGCTVAVATGRPSGCLPADLTPCPAWVSWLVLYDGAEIREAKTGACIWRKPFFCGFPGTDQPRCRRPADPGRVHRPGQLVSSV